MGDAHYLPQPPLSEVPGRGARGVARRPQAELLPVPYFHVVFTLPAGDRRRSPSRTRRIVYDLLIPRRRRDADHDRRRPKHLGAQIGVIAVLHTWGQTLTHHPHVHCLVPGGGVAVDGTRWIACKPGFFLPSGCCPGLFRRLFLDASDAPFRRGGLASSAIWPGSPTTSVFAERARAAAASADWVVYAKRAFRRTRARARLSRPLHPPRRDRQLQARCASTTMASHSATRTIVADGRARKVMTLAPHEFIRRFLLHVLPGGFHRIRHYGFFAKGDTRLQSRTRPGSTWIPGWPGARRRRAAGGRRAQGRRSSRFRCRLSRLRRPDAPHRAHPRTTSRRLPLRHVMTVNAPLDPDRLMLQRRAVLPTAPRRTAP